MMPMEKVEVLRACCCVTGMGGETAAEERAFLSKLAGQVGVGQASLDAMVARGETDPQFYQEQFKVLKVDPEQALTILIEAANCDDHVTPEEIMILRKFGTKLGMTEQDFEKLLNRLIRKP